MTGTSLVLVECALGIVAVDLDGEAVVGFASDARLERPALELPLPLVLDADVHGSTVVAVVDRRPPLIVSSDGGSSWREAGGGLPPGRAVAISPQHPDRILFASAERLYLSEDGGRFWRALAPELIDVTRIAWDAGE